MILKYHTLFFRKLGKISENLSSAAVVIGALKVNTLGLQSWDRYIMVMLDFLCFQNWWKRKL